MKPDWKDAPEWADWLAMDKDGTWCWYEERLEVVKIAWEAHCRWDICDFVLPWKAVGAAPMTHEIQPSRADDSQNYRHESVIERAWEDAWKDDAFIAECLQEADAFFVARSMRIFKQIEAESARDANAMAKQCGQYDAAADMLLTSLRRIIQARFDASPAFYDRAEKDLLAEKEDWA